MVGSISKRILAGLPSGRLFEADEPLMRRPQPETDAVAAPQRRGFRPRAPVASHHATLILLRHGCSEWNRSGRFTGWADVKLSARGVLESQRAAFLLKHSGYVFERCFASVLQRSITTARIVLRELEREHIGIESSWRLNERHYGALQGLGPVAAVLRYGPGIRRTQNDLRRQPPPLATDDPRFPGFDPRYSDLPPDELPRTESLEDTYRRMLPFWEQKIVPELAAGKNVLVVAHKHVLRGLRKRIEGVADRDLRSIKVQTGVPWVFRLDSSLSVMDSRALGEESFPAFGGSGARDVG